MINIFTTIMSKRKKNTMLPLMGLVLRTIRSLQLVHHIYTSHMSSVLKVHGGCHNVFRTAPFLLGTVGTGTQGYPIGNACVERSKTGFLSFHRIHAIFRVSCILHSKVPYGAFLKAPLFFKASGSPIQFDLTVPVA
jgi:hypothetical protein